MAGSQINRIDVNFHLQKSLEIFDENSADKIWSKKDKEIKVSPFMPIMVKNTTTTTYVLYFDLLFEVKQLGLNWTTRYILKFGLNLRFTALYVLCVKLLVSTIAQGIYSLSVASPYEL